MTDRPEEVLAAQPPGPCDVAIIGMACIFPKAPNVQAYWQNIVSKVDAVSDPPPGWLQDGAFDPDSHGNDQIYCKRGGYLGDLSEFAPLEYGVMPVAVDGGEPEHFLALRVAHEAIADAGYMDHPFNRERTAVILGRGTFINRGNVTALQHGFVINQTLMILKQLHPEYSDPELQAIKRKLKETLPPFNAETAPSLVSNVMCGRIANRLGLMGPNYAVDAACASSLIAVDLGIRELLSRQCDMALVGGVSVSIPPMVHMVFCQLNALSRRSQIRPFAKDADGILMGEGLGMVVLKRRQDAERDGDRIYAVIKGVGTASDGRGKSVLTPRVEGEELALRRAYEAAGISPDTIELVEAHGTGTPVGDATEIQALRRVFGTGNGNAPRCALGSVKSMIGHTIPAAGVAGLIKTALALYHKVLPPTLHCEEPDPKLELETTPFYINTETRPWIHGDRKTPRRAGVNAFGFGGINAHVILEEASQQDSLSPVSFHQQWDSEVCILSGESRQALICAAEEVRAYLAGDPPSALKDIAYTLNIQLKDRPWRLAVVAATTQELRDKLAHALSRLADPQCRQIKDLSGIFFFEEQLASAGQLALLFPGEGAQYSNMLAGLCMHFPEVRAAFDLQDQAFLGRCTGGLPSQAIFPAPAMSGTPAGPAAEKRLWEMDGAVQSVATASRAFLALFEKLEIRPHAVVGHSTGELVALIASGAVRIHGADQFIGHALHLNAIGQQLHAEGAIPAGVLLTVGGASAEVIRSVIEQSEGPLYVAMDNCPNQIVVCGDRLTADRAIERLRDKGAIVNVLPFERAYHTPLFGPAGERLREFYAKLPVGPPRLRMYSCATAHAYPEAPAEIRRLAVLQWASPVRFRETIEQMYADGVRIFLEAGPRGNLTAFVTDILKRRPHLAAAANVPQKSDITQLNYCLGLLAAHGVPMRLEHLYARRQPCSLSFAPAPRPASGPTQSVQVKLNLPLLRLPQGEGAVEEPRPDSSGVTVKPSVIAFSEQEARGTTEGPPVAAKAGRTLGETWRGQPALAPGNGRVMREYLQTMESFLHAQQAVMQAYFRGEAAADGTAPAGRAHAGMADSPARPLLSEASPSLQAEALAPGATSDLPVRERNPVDQEAPPPGESTPAGAEALHAILLDIVSEKTGYPKDVLGVTLNMEADLGIDSIKRVEILGVFRSRTGAIREEDMETVSGFKTLQQVIDFAAAAGRPGSAGSRVPQQASETTTSAYTHAASLPFVGTVTEVTPGREIVITRQLDLKEDVLFRDHTIGGPVSAVDPELTALPVVPFAVRVEVMAEAASLLCPGQVLVGMKDVRTFQWLAIDEEKTTLRIRAKRKNSPINEEVDVEVCELAGSNTGSQEPVLMAKATAIFGAAYPDAPSDPVAVIQDSRSSRFHQGQYYTEVMFHGPKFRSVASVDCWGQTGIDVTVRVLPKGGLFRSIPSPSFVADPLLLDAAGQAVGFWTAEHLERGFVVFPVGFESMQVYGPWPAAGGTMKVKCRSRLVADDRIQSDIVFLDEQNRPRIKLQGWNDRRYDFPWSIVRFNISMKDRMLSMPWKGPLLTHLPRTFTCCRLDPLPDVLCQDDTVFWARAWARLILSPRERRMWRALQSSRERRKNWVAGRLAAKDAVRLYLGERYGLRLCPADVEIIPDEHGRPMVQGTWTGEVKDVPCVSISHTEGTAVAIAGEGAEGRGLGIDVERLGRGHEGLAEGAFTEAERAFLDGMSGDAREEWLVRMFCAKEAVGKAIGRGMEGGPRSLVIHDLNREDGTVMVRVAGELARLCPEWSAGAFAAGTVRDGDYVVAVSLCSRSQEQIR